LSYRYDRDGAPLLVVEVVSHSNRELRDNDWRHKMAVYAHMRIREYWLVDKLQPYPLNGFTLDAVDGIPLCLPQYRPIDADADGGMDSLVLSVSLRWADGDLQYWQEGSESWVRVEDIPVVQARLESKAEGKLEGALELCGPLLHSLLDATNPGAADLILQTWAETPPLTWPNQDTWTRLATSPGSWRSLLLEEVSPEDAAA